MQCCSYLDPYQSPHTQREPTTSLEVLCSLPAIENTYVRLNGEGISLQFHGGQEVMHLNEIHRVVQLMKSAFVLFVSKLFYHASH